MEQKYNKDKAKQLYYQMSSAANLNVNEDDFYKKLDEKDDNYARGLFGKFKKIGVNLLGADNEDAFIDSLGYKLPELKQDEIIPIKREQSKDTSSFNLDIPDSISNAKIPMVKPMAPQSKAEDFALTIPEQKPLLNPLNPKEVTKISDIIGETPQQRIQAQINELGEDALNDKSKVDYIKSSIENQLSQINASNEAFLKEYENNLNATKVNNVNLHHDEWRYVSPRDYKKSKESAEFVAKNTKKYDEIQAKKNALQRQYDLLDTYSKYAEYDRQLEVGKRMSTLVSDGKITEDTMKILRSNGSEKAKDEYLTRLYNRGEIDKDTLKEIYNLGDLTEDNGFVYGAFNTGKWADILTLGMNEIARNLDINSIYDKYYNGEPITDEEMGVIQMYSQLLGIQKKAESDEWASFRYGQGFQQSLRFVAEMGLTGGVGAIGKNLGVKGAIAVANRYGRKKALGMVLGNMVKNLPKNIGKQALATPFTPSSYTNYTDRLIKLNIENEGNISAKDKFNALRKAYTDTFTERFSESLGSIVSDVPLWSVLTKGKATKWLAEHGFERALQLGERISGNEAFSTTRDLLHNVGITGIPEEMLSEMSGTLMNAALQWDGEILDEINSDFFAQTALTSILMGGMGGVVNYTVGSVGAIVQNNQMRKAYDEAMGKMKSVSFQSDSLNELKKELEQAIYQQEYIAKDGSDVRDVARIISDMNIELARLEQFANNSNIEDDKIFSNRENAVMGIIDNAVRTGAYRYGEQQAIKSYVADKMGVVNKQGEKIPLEFEHEDGNVYEFTDSRGNNYFILDESDDVVVLVDRTTGEKIAKPKDILNSGNITTSQSNEWAMNAFIGNIDNWNQVAPESAKAKINETPATHLEINGKFIPVTKYDPDTKRYTISDEQGNETEFNADDPTVTPVWETADGQLSQMPIQSQQTEENPIVEEEKVIAEPVIQPEQEVAQTEENPIETEVVENEIEYDDKGDPVWSKITAERAKQEIDGAFEEDEAKAFIADKIKAAEKAVKTAEKKKPKAQSIRDRKAEIEQIKVEREQAQSTLDYWNSVSQLYVTPQPTQEVAEEVPVAETEQVFKNTSDSILQEGVTPYTVGENIKQKYNDAPKAYGVEDTYTDAEGNNYKGRWVIVEADAVTPSHNANTLSSSEGFPVTDKGRNVNDNDYSNKAGVVETMAANYDARALDEPVIVSEGAIVSGNNRTISRQLSAQKGTDSKYKEALPSKAQMRGISAEELGKFQNPTLVFELAEPVEYTTETFSKFNRPRSKTKSPVDMAIAIGKQDTSRLVGQVLSTIGEVEKLSELYQNQNKVAEIMKQVVESGIINQNEMPQFYSQEYGITDAGKDFIETLLIGSVINEDQIRILNSEGMKQYREKIVSSMLPIAKNMKFEDNIGNRLNTAIKYLKEARDAKTDLRGILLDNPIFDAKEYEDLTIFTALMLQRKPSEFRDFINNLNDRLSLGGENLFGEQETAQSVLEDYKQQNKLTDNERETIRLAEQTRNSATQSVYGGVQADGTNADNRGEGVDGSSISETESAEKWSVDNITEDEEENVTFEEVLNVFDEYQQELDKINKKIQNEIEDAKKNGLPPLISPSLKEEKRKLLENFISELTTDKFSVVTIDNAVSVMKADGLTNDEIRRYMHRAYYVGTGRALFTNGKYYFFSENIKTIDKARRCLIHERQHRLTSENASLIDDVVSNSTREELQKIVKKFSNTDSYDGSSHRRLADEVISFSMEEAYSTSEYVETLKNYGLSDKLIDIIKRIDDEQKNSSSLFNARRGTARNKNVSGVGQNSSGQNGRNKEQRPAEVGESRFRSTGPSGEGTWNISRDSDRLERTAEQKQALFDKAKEIFGTTNNFKVAGYMLPDGSLLDFSGRWEGGPGDARYTDHRAIGSGLYEASETDSNYDTNMYDFINQGAIRLMPESAGIYVSQPLTEKQEDRLASYIYRNNGEVILEIIDNDGNSISYIEYNRRTSPEKVLSDISNYFEKGVEPVQPEIRFRLVDGPMGARQHSEEVMRESIDKMAQDLGVNAEYVSDEKQIDKKGWYDPAIGKVYVNLAAHETIDDAKATYLHEVVGHFGLRGLLKDKFEKVMNDVFNSLPKDVQDRLFDEYKDKTIAAEEYLASMIENDVEPSLVEKILGFIREALRSIGINFDNYTNGDLEYLLWRSKNNLRENTGHVEAARWGAKNKEIRHRSINRPAGYTTNKMEMTDKDKLLHSIQDRMRPVKKIMDEIINRGGTIDGVSDPYTQEFLATSRAAAEIEDFTNEKYEPLGKAIADAMKVFTEEFGMLAEDARKAVDDYLYARHAPERNKHICVNEIVEAGMKVATDKTLVNDAFKAEIRRMAEQLYDNQFRNGKNVISPKGLSKEQTKLAMVVLGKMNQETIEISRKKDDDGVLVANNRSGMTDAEAEGIMKNLYTPNTKAVLDEVSARVKDCTDFTLDKWMEYGLISDEEYLSYKNQYEYYIPLRGWDEKGEDIDYMAIPTKQFNAASNLVNLNRKAEGRISKAENPLAYIASLAQSACVTGNKNLIRQQAFRMVEKNEGLIDDLAVIENTYEIYDDNGNIIGYTKRRPSQALIDQGRVKAIRDRDYAWHKTGSELGAHRVPVLFNGVVHMLYFKGEIGALAATAINGTDRDTKNIVTQLSSQATRWISSNLTAKNIYFLGKNLVRDLGFGNFAYFVENGFGKTAKLNKYFMQAIRTAALDAMGADPSTFADSALYKEFKENGGQTGYVQMESINKLAKKMDKIINDASANRGIVAQQAVNAKDLLFETFDVLGKASENAMRFAIYKLERENGSSARQAAIRAKEITVNFNRQGKNTKGFSAVYAFFNPAVQGAYRYAKLAKENPARFMAITASLMAVKFGLAMMCELFSGSGDDDENKGESAYDRLSDYVKATNWVIPLGGWTEGGDDKFLCIPMPQSVRATTYLADLAVDAIYGRKNFGEVIKDYALFNVGEFMPFDIDAIDLTSDNPAATILQAVSPTLARPVIENVINRDFMGNPITKEPFVRSQDYIPQYQLAFQTTSPLLVGTSKLLNELAGGDEKRSAGIQISENGQVSKSAWSILDVNPAKVEHLFSGYFGGMFKPMLDTYDLMRSVVDEDVEMNVSSAVLVNQFIKGPTSKPGYKKFYELRDEAQTVKDIKNLYKEDYLNENYRPLNSNPFNYEIEVVYEAYNDLIKVYNENIMLIRNNADRVDDSSAQIKQLEKERDEIILQAANKYRDICDRRDKANKEQE